MRNKRCLVSPAPHVIPGHGAAFRAEHVFVIVKSGAKIDEHVAVEIEVAYDVKGEPELGGFGINLIEASSHGYDNRCQYEDQHLKQLPVQRHRRHQAWWPTQLLIRVWKGSTIICLGPPARDEYVIGTEEKSFSLDLDADISLCAETRLLLAMHGMILFDGLMQQIEP